jgi:hypothetical protein
MIRLPPNLAPGAIASRSGQAARWGWPCGDVGGVLSVMRLFSQGTTRTTNWRNVPGSMHAARSLVQIIAELAALSTHAKPNKPLQRTGARAARTGR